MLILGAIVLGLLALVGFVIYLSVMIAFWLMVAVFFAFTIVIALVVGDPYVGFFGAIPATGIVLWLIGRNSEKTD